MNKTNELTFQNDMIKQLIANGWLLGKPENYNRELALYEEEQKIISYSHKKWMVFGRQKRSLLTGCSHGELFAWSFLHSHAASFKHELFVLCNSYYKNGINVASGWGHYNIRSNLRFLMSKNKIIKGYALASNFTHIDDFTDDFDYPDDYNMWLNQFLKWKKTPTLNKYMKLLTIEAAACCTKICNMAFEIALIVHIKIRKVGSGLRYYVNKNNTQ